MVYMATPAIVGLNLLLLHISCVTSQSLPSFTLHPLSGVYRNLSEVSLRCETSPITDIQWLHNGRLIFTDSRRTVGLNTLTIISLTSDVTGSYACLARSDLGTVVSAVANIQIAVLEANLPTLANPHIVTVQEHQPVALNCGTIVTVPPFRHPLIWETYHHSFNLELLENEFTGLNRSLYIPDPTVSSHDGNIYECSYRDRVNRISVQGYVQFQVQASTSPPPAPHFIQEPQDLVVNVGEGAYFDCVVGGFPLPTQANISWLVPPTLQPSSFRVTKQNRQARILTTQTADAGTYTCNVTGVGERRATLTVREPPVVTPLPSFVRNKVYGAPFSLECLATGIDVSWQWYHNGTLMETITGRTLNILSTVEEDSGVYQCFAYNPAGNDSAVAVLRVSPQPVTFTNRTLPPQQVAFVGRPFEFVCSATGAPPPQYFWSKNGVPLGNNSGFEVHLSGELKIGSVAVTHNGLYTCLAVNRIGEREIGSVQATSQLFAIVPTTITSPPVSESPAQIGTSTTLPCDASYQPGARVTYSWTKNESPITIDGEAVSFASNTSGDIIIANVQNSDAGEYRCTVATTYNQLQAPSVSSGVIRVTITTSPVGPMVFRVNATSTNITVSWYLTTFSTNPPSMYAIEVQQGRVASDRWDIVHNQSALAITNATVGNFHPFNWYCVRVVAVFSDGERVGSSVHTVMTSEDRPWGPPTNVKVSTFNETTLQVQWEPPLVSLRNGLILSYTIKFRPRNTGSFISVSLDNVTSHVLTDLREKALYDVRVAANTSVGMGPFSDIQVASTNIGGLQENSDPAFYQTAWFIVVMFLLVLGLLTGAVVVVCVVRRNSTHGKKKYHVRPASGYFGAGVKDVSLSEAAMNDYESRSSRFGSAKGFEGVETESSLVGSHSTQYTPSLQMRLAAINAPSYIDPPPFEEALKHRARPHSASIQPEITGTASDWSVEQGSRSLLTTHHPHLAVELHANGPVQYDYADSAESDSAEKPSYSSLEGSEESPSQVSNTHSSPTTKYATFV